MDNDNTELPNNRDWQNLSLITAQPSLSVHQVTMKLPDPLSYWL
jgi:hypothetical protein